MEIQTEHLVEDGSLFNDVPLFQLKNKMPIKSANLLYIKYTNSDNGILEVRFYHEGQIVNHDENIQHFENLVTKNEIEAFKKLVPSNQTFYFDIYSNGNKEADPRFKAIIESLPKV